MKKFMRIGVVLAGAIILLGCQKTDDTSDMPPPGSAAEAPDEATAAGPEATADPQTTTGSPVDSDAVTDAPAGNADLVARVKELMLMKTVEQTDTGIEITFFLEQAATVDDKSKPPIVTDAMMFATFYTAQLLYGRLQDIDGLEQIFIYKGDAIGEIKMTRASYKSLGHPAAMQGVADPAAKRGIYQKLLEKLPKGSVRIDKKYRP